MCGRQQHAMTQSHTQSVTQSSSPPPPPSRVPKKAVNSDNSKIQCSRNSRKRLSRCGGWAGFEWEGVVLECYEECLRNAKWQALCTLCGLSHWARHRYLHRHRKREHHNHHHICGIVAILIKYVSYIQQKHRATGYSLIMVYAQLISDLFHMFEIILLSQ